MDAYQQFFAVIAGFLVKTGDGDSSAEHRKAEEITAREQQLLRAEPEIKS
jgi:hypothetical protein